MEFLLIYIREAHPSDGVGGRPMKSPGQPDIKQPKTDGDRREAAGSCVKNLKLTMTTLIDGMDNKVGEAYAGWPDRLYVIDKNGKITYKGEKGPRGFKPAEAEDAIKKLIGKKTED